MQTDEYISDTAGNPIQLTSDQFTVTTDGWIQQNGQNVARLGIGYAENPTELTKTGEGLFHGMMDKLYLLLMKMIKFLFLYNKGTLNVRNVDATESMTEMLAAYRTFGEGE